MLERYPEDNDPWNAGYNCCYDKAIPEIDRLTAALRQIMDLADKGPATEGTLNQIGHIADEAVGTDEQGSDKC